MGQQTFFNQMFNFLYFPVLHCDGFNELQLNNTTNNKIVINRRRDEILSSMYPLMVDGKKKFYNYLVLKAFLVLLNSVYTL